MWLRDIACGVLLVIFTIGAFWGLDKVAALMQAAGVLE